MTHKLIFPILLVFLLSACATNGDSPERLQSQLAERAQARWKYLLEGDWNEAWAFLTPGYREAMTQERYARSMSRKSVRWDGATVDRVECESAEKCDVVMRVQFATPLPGLAGNAHNEGLGTGYVRESWLRDATGWFHLPAK